jgi:hypothetical protein
MKKAVLAVVLGSLLGLGVVAANTTTRWKCSLTGKTVEKCCCVEQKDGKLFCTLAKKTIDSCCCKAADAQATK